MYFRIQPAWNFCKRLLGAAPKVLVGLFGLGLFLGIVAISMWEQWSLTFGLDPQFLLPVSFVLSLAFLWGPSRQKLQRTSDGNLLGCLILYLCAWSLLHPFWIEAMTFIMSGLPLAWFEQTTTKHLLRLWFSHFSAGPFRQFYGRR